MKKLSSETKAVITLVCLALALGGLAVFGNLLGGDLVAKLEAGNRPAGAKEELEELVEEGPENAKARGWLLHLYLEDREMKKADQLLSSLLVKAPDQYLTQRGACRFSLIKKQSENAIKHCRKALSLSDRSASDLNNLAAAYLYFGSYSRAIELLKEARQKDPSNIKVHNNLGYGYRKLGIPAEAIKSLQKALELDPQSIDAHKNLAQVYYENDRIKSCIKELEKVLEQDPDDYQSLLILSVIHLEYREDFEKARNYASRAAKTGKDANAKRILHYINEYEKHARKPGSSTGVSGGQTGD
ncbi:MAG: tetratricopeptide repeat protein [bacterium]